MQTQIRLVQPAWFEWLTIAALILGPILALLAQRGLDWLREKEERQKKLYFTMMATRAQWLSNEHVQAVNSIDVVFATHKNIRDLWKKCLDHVAKDENLEGWADTLTDLRADLYQAIGNKLGYKYTTDYIKRGIYFPKQHSFVIENQNKLLLGMARAVEAGKLKVELCEPTQPTPQNPPQGIHRR
jgi:hypothetical protein